MRSPRGFTIVEMMVVIALIGILAAIAIPALMDSKRKISSASEVGQFFAELRVREDQYYAENHAFLGTGTEATPYPALPATSGQTFDITNMPAEWKTMKVHPPLDTVHCTFVVVASNQAAPIAAGAKATAMGFVAPAKDWYYMLAHCDADGDTTADAYFLESSESSEKLVENADR